MFDEYDDELVRDYNRAKKMNRHFVYANDAYGSAEIGSYRLADIYDAYAESRACEEY